MGGRYLRTENTTKRIVSVKFKSEVDTDPDLSFLGEYSNAPAEVHIDREARGECVRGEYRYFNAGCGDPDYIEEDYKRYEALIAGDWCMTYLFAEARISVCGVMQRVASGGLGGVESDCGKEYHAEIRGEQLDELRGVLKSLGFKKKQIDEAFAECNTDPE